MRGREGGQHSDETRPRYAAFLASPPQRVETTLRRPACDDLEPEAAPLAVLEAETAASSGGAYRKAAERTIVILSLWRYSRKRQLHDNARLHSVNDSSRTILNGCDSGRIPGVRGH